MKKYISIVLVLVLVVALAGCGGGAKGKLESITKAGKMVVYMDPNFPPFEFMGSNGAEGVDVEIANAIGKELGVDVEIQEAKFDSIVMAIKGGKGDIAISGMTITEDRKKSVDFSDPYIKSVQYLILNVDSDITTMEDLAGKKIGVAIGYTGSLLIDDEINLEDGTLKGTGATFTEYPSAMEATLDLNNNKVDCVVMDEYVAKNIAQSNDKVKTIELKYANGDLAAEEYGVVVAQGNEELLEKINAVVKKLVDEGQIEKWIVQFAS